MPISFTAHRKSADEPYTLLQIAGEHYVGARLSFVGSAAFPAQLAMQQCLETAAKAILKAATPGRRFGGKDGHDISRLLKELAPRCSCIEAVLMNADAARVVDVLGSGYNRIRYGEGILGMELTGTLKAFDNLAWSLLSDAGRALHYPPHLSFYIGEHALSAFLWRMELPIVSIEHCSEVDDQWPHAQVVLEQCPSPG